MVNDYWMIWVFGIQNCFTIVKALWIFIGKIMVNDCCTVSAFGIY